MSALSVNPPFPVFTGIDGQPLEDGYLWMGLPNLSPITNPIQVYWDAARTIPAAQPIRTLGGYPVNSGTPARLFVDQDYSILVQNKKGSMVYSAPTSPDLYIIESNLGIFVGGVGNNIADDTLAIQAAFNSASNGDVINFGSGLTYRTTAPIVVPPNLTGCVIRGNGSTIRADHNGDGLVMIATNQNFSRHKVYDLNVQGPNVSYPNNPGELAGTSTGAGLKMGYDNTTNTVAGYLTSFYNCSFSKFNKGVYLQATILVNFYGGYITFNQSGVYVDGGQTNANTFYGVGIRENRQFGVYSSGRTGGSLSNATHNVFHSCEIETNIPYDSSAGGYPAAFNAAIGHGIKLWNSYDWIFDSCYLENHNYSVVLDGSSDDNRFKSCRFDGGGSGGVRPGSVVIGGTSCNNNVFIDCKMVDYVGYAEGTFQNLSSTNLYNQLIDCIGFSFNPTYVLAWPNIQNLRKAQGSEGSGQQFGALVIPPQGILSNPGPGTNQGQINGIGTAAATLNAFGYSHFLFGNHITGDTTITAISNMRPGQTLVLTNYQTSFAVSIASATTGTGAIQLKNLRSVKMNKFGQTITLFCNTLGQIVEVGRNFSDAVKGSGTITGTNTSVAVTFAAAGYANEPDSAYEVFLTPSPNFASNPSDSYLGDVAFASKTTTGFTISSKAAPGAGNSTIWYWQIIR
jgi:hypothetical protein